MAIKLFKATVEYECLFLADDTLPEHVIRSQAESHMNDEITNSSSAYLVDYVTPMTKTSPIPASYDGDGLVWSDRKYNLGDVTVDEALEKYT